MQKLIKIWTAINIIRVLPHIFLFYRSSEKAVIEKDLERWFQIKQLQPNYPTWKKLVWILLWYPEFRNLFYFRIKKDYFILSKLLPFICSHKESLEIKCDVSTIGPGLYIQHGTGTLFAVKSMGKNCWISQGVSIGYANYTDYPIIGDNVTIAPGAKIFGNIAIGDNSIVGANAVVLKNVPPNCTVVGVPAYIIKRDGKKTKEPLV